MAPSVALAARFVLAGTLAWAGVAKLRGLAALPAQLRALGFPDLLARPLAWLLPLVESVLAVALAALWGSSWPAWTAVGLLGAFTVVIVATMSRRAPCPCFGMSAEATGARTIVRNAVLLAVAVLGTGTADGATASEVVPCAAVLGALVVGSAVLQPRRRSRS